LQLNVKPYSQTYIPGLFSSSIFDMHHAHTTMITVFLLVTYGQPKKLIHCLKKKKIIPSSTR